MRRKPTPAADAFLPAAGPETLRGAKGPCDVVLVTGDAYVDHPSFGAALIGRHLDSLGYRVAVLAQPPWDTEAAFRVFGRPRLFFAVTSGAVDAALNLRHSLGGKRERDVYSPGGAPGRRPARPLVVYANLARRAYPGVPVVLGGLEASLKRLVHVDPLSRALRRPVLLDAKADLLVFGMGEAQVEAVARRLAAGEDVTSLTDIPGTSWRVRGAARPPAEALRLPSFAAQRENPRAVVEAQLRYEAAAVPGGPAVVQDGDPGAVVVLPPATPLAPEALDRLFALPFRREAHPMYGAARVPALEPVRFSVVTHRGCFGGCAFCSLAAHQGRRIVSRSKGSILAELEGFRRHPAFRGSVPDLGAPTANMYGVACAKGIPCARPSCLFPEPCPNLTGPGAMMELLEAVAALPGLKVRVASGVRHDLALQQTGYVELLASRFTGGQLKVAPEHRDAAVLRRMRKPPFALFEEFEARFREASARAGREQYLVPYFVSGHPGCGMREAVALTAYLMDRGWKPRQVQDFTPIPLTLSAALHAAGTDETGAPLHVPSPAERRDQLALLRYDLPENRARVARLLREAGRRV